MELNYLREFVALVQSCQFQETADRLFISQSSLSKHIKTIEKELGAELLTRSTRRVELSEFGRAFLPYAQKITQLQEEYTTTLLPEVRGQKRKIIIGVIPLVTFYWMKDFMSVFAQKHPEYSVEFLEHNDDKLREMLRSGACDFIIACEAPDGLDSEFGSVPYAYDSLVAVLREDHPLAGRDVLHAGDLAAFPLIHLGKTNVTRHLDDTLQNASYVASRGHMLMDMVRRGMGVGIMTTYAFHFFAQPGVCHVSLCPPLKVHLNFLYMKQRRKNAAVISTIIDYMHVNTDCLPHLPETDG